MKSAVTNIATVPIFRLVVALARDLQHEFYPHYSEFVHNLIDLLNMKDTDVLEWTFTCLAYLSKFLWRYLVKDVSIVFTDLLPLLHDSRPDYINSFAAESFAFVARKVKDKKAFLLLVLKTLKKHPEGVAGCGHLLFEVVHGVAGQFHSCAAVVLPLVFEMLSDKSVSQSLLFEVLCCMVSAMVNLIQPKKSGLFWTSAFKTVGSFVSMWEKDDLDSHIPIYLLLKLILQAVSYKNAVFVSDPATVAQHIIELLKIEEAEDVLLVSSEIGAALLMSSVVSLTQEYASRMILKVLAVPYTSVLLMFVQRVVTYPAFEVLVLPHLMYQCQSILSSDSVVGIAGIGRDFLNLLTRLVLCKAPLCRTGMDLKCWHQYPLDFINGTCRRNSGSETVSVPSMFLDVLYVNDINQLLMEVEDFLCVTICLPHIKQLDQNVAIRQLKHVIILLCSSLKQTSDAVDSKCESASSQSMQHESKFSQNETVGSEGSLRIHLLVLTTVLETVIHLTNNKMLKEVCNSDMLVDSVLPYACDPTNLSALRALDLYFTAYKLETEEGAFCLELFGRLHSKLFQNLSSPFHKVRLLTLHVFSLFEQPHGSIGSEGVIGWPGCGLCLCAELVQPTVHEYRKKLQHLQSLEFTAIHAHLLKFPEYCKVLLHFLLGNLYINFQLLWEPTSKLIASYAQRMNITDFWEVFGEKLHMAAKQSKGFNQETVPLLSLKCDFLLDFFTTLNQLDDKPDYINYRLLLWKAMLEFPDVCETKNRDISPLFLTFLEDEYYKSNSEIAYSWSIKIRNVSVKEKYSDKMDLMVTEEAMKDVELMTIKKEHTEFPKSSHTSGRTMLKTLLAHMNIFSKMKNPRSIHREPDLNRIYLEFLTHKNPDVQKMALDCLVSYKSKYLIPYREHLYGLIDDKTFKTELTVFRIDKESELIQAEHRTELMPFVMRILFSKMLTRTGSKSAGSGQLRCSLVLRFLAGCHESEMFLFVEMAFKIYAEFIKDDPVTMVDSILESLDLEHIIPPKRLQSSLNLLSVVLEKFGRLIGQRLLPYLLRVLFCISAIVQGALARRDMVHPGYLTTLLTLRNSCQGIAACFFEHFDNYAWSEVEVDTVFQMLVWPWLEKLPVEGIHSPTALLKLFLVWSKHPRYFALLAKHADGNKSLTPLPYIMNLLLRTQTHPSVTTAVMELVERLLTLQDYQEERTEGTDVAPDIPVPQKLQVDSEAVARLSLCENLNYGSCLLLPHIPAILEHLEHKLGSVKQRSLGSRDLVILSRATELVWDASTSDTLLRLLLPLLGKKTHAGEETVSHLITTLDNLFRNVMQPEKHLR